jgi:hypothetical protein
VEGLKRTPKARLVAFARFLLPISVPLVVHLVAWEILGIRPHRGETLLVVPLCMALALPLSRSYRRSLWRSWKRSSKWKRALGILWLAVSIAYVSLAVWIALTEDPTTTSRALGSPRVTIHVVAADAGS